jgi:hypothetical protein
MNLLSTRMPSTPLNLYLDSTRNSHEFASRIQNLKMVIVRELV